MAPSLTARVRFGLWRFPLLHKPLRWFKRMALPAMAGLVYELGRKIFPRSIAFGPPCSWYSAYDLLLRSDSGVEGGIVLTDQGSPALHADSMILLCGRNQHREQPWPIFWTRHRNARLIGTSLVHVNEQKELCVEAAYGLRRVTSDPAYRYFMLRPPLLLDGPWTSIVSSWVPTDKPQPYAHWLLEALPRLALLKEFPSDTQILVPPHKLRYQVESLSLLGVLGRCRWTRETNLLVKDYYFSSQPSMIVCYSPYTVAFLRSRFLPLALLAPATPRRFFVRRTSYARNVVNEQEVLDFFQNAGWSVVDTAAMGFKEQVQLFAGAEAVCGIHGSGLANAVWCPASCKVIELFADSYLAGDQEWICQCIKAGYHFLIFPSDYKLCAVVDLARLQKLLCSLHLL
jgi:Glycosyltransferase 61